MTTSNAYSTGKLFDGYMGRNRIINGGMTVAQRPSATISTNNVYAGPDRYNASVNLAGGSFTQAAGTITYNGITRPAIAQTVVTGTSSFGSTNFWYGIHQVIEGYNSYDLIGQPISVSFIFNTNVSGTYSLALRDGSATNSYVTTFTATANTPARYTFNIPASAALAIPASTASGLDIAIGFLNTATYTTSAINLWQSGNFVAATGAVNWAATAGNFIAVAELQLEEGAIATPFERENVGTTLNKCMRYYQILGTASSGGIITTPYNGAGGTCYNTTILPVPLRLSLVGPTGGPATSGATISLTFNYSNMSGGSVRYDFSSNQYIMTQAAITTAGSGFYYFTGNVSAEF